MQEIVEFVLRRGYWLLFCNVLAEQMGIPVPALPILMAMGALAGLGHFSLPLALAVAWVAAMTADLSWFYLGRTKGRSIIGFLCRIAVEPDSCVKRTENLFTRLGVRSLVVAKFIPGLSAASTPLAGWTGVSTARFLLWDGIGSLLWTGAYLATGYLFRHQLQLAADAALTLGSWLIVLLAAGLTLYISWKYVQRRRFLRRVRLARIHPDDLQVLLESGEDVLILDLRNTPPTDPRLPGALVMRPSEIEDRHHEIPRDRDIILYCT